MAKFIKFNVVNTLNAASLLLQGTRLVNVDHIGDVSYNAVTGAVTIVLTAPAGAFGENTATAGISGRIITAVATTSTTGAAGVPTITAGASAPDKAIYKAMTANPRWYCFFSTIRCRSSSYTITNVLVKLHSIN